MNRKTFASLCISLVLALFVMGSLPLASADAPNAPVGITETPVATETSTSAPTNTPTPTKAPAQSPANTAVPSTSTPTLTPASTPTATPVLVLPVSGAPSEPIDDWFVGLPAILALIVGAVAALALGWFHESTVKRVTHGETSGGPSNRGIFPPMEKTE